MSPARILSELVKVVLAEGICIEEVCLTVALTRIPSRPVKIKCFRFIVGEIEESHCVGLPSKVRMC